MKKTLKSKIELANYVLADLERKFDTLSIIVGKVNSLGINCTTHHLMDALFNDCDGITKEFGNQIIGKLNKKFHVGSQRAIERDKLKCETDKIIQSIRNDAEKIRVHWTAETSRFIQLISIEKGKVVIKESLMTEIQEYFQSLVNTEEGLMLMNLHTKATKAMNEFIDELKKFNNTQYSHTSAQFMGYYFNPDWKTKVFHQRVLEYDQIAKISIE